MAKISPISNTSGEQVGYSFFCPGCNDYHVYYTRPWTGGSYVNGEWVPKAGPVWTFTGTLENPTFRPSLRIYEGRHPDGEVSHPACHLFVTDGKIHYCGDCGHDLKGQVVDMRDEDRA